MTDRQLRIVSVSSEVAPFAKAGGLADVSRSLPRALVARGHDVTVIAPLHGVIDRDQHRLELIADQVTVPIDDQTARKASFWRAPREPGAPHVYFIDYGPYFSNRRYIYGSECENRRFLFFDRAVFVLLEHLQLRPHILQCHDWQTGLIPYFLHRQYRDHPLFRETKTVYTIHNLAFQFGHPWWQIPNDQKDHGRDALPPFDDRDAIERVNFAKRAILNADVINAVSPQYAKEILTPNFGQDLNRILKHREDRLYGILNGIDYVDYNPATDPGLTATYTADSLDAKVQNKVALQLRFGLPVDPHVPVLGMVSRITEQKGFDLLLDIADPLLRQDTQLVILGGGDPHYESRIRAVRRRHPKRAACHLEFDTQIETLVYAGANMLLMPSHFEPSGLGQMIGLRYGAIPVVRATGGLADSVTNYNPRTGKGNGFVFRNYDSRDFLVAITRGLETYRYQDQWQQLVQRSMRESFSWDLPAERYIALFRKVLRT